jgi:TDG/mug DNA glycosylase family protein
MNKPQRKPTKEELAAAYGKSLPDVIDYDLKLLFVGINPGLYTAAIGHHFGRPGNRFWPTLYRAGFTPRLLSPYEERELLAWGYGITNVVNRATATAGELSPQELQEGGYRLAAKVQEFRPACVAVLGVGAYRGAFQRPKAAVGVQSERIAGALTWVLPNPSGLNAHYQLDDLAQVFRELWEAIEAYVSTKNRGA